MINYFNRVCSLARSSSLRRWTSALLCVFALLMSTAGTYAADITTTGTQHVVAAPGVYDFANIYDYSTLTLGPGVEITDYVYVHFHGQLNVTGGSIGGNIYASGDDGMTRIAGGTIEGSIATFGATVHVRGGTVMGKWDIVHDSTGYLSSGTINDKVVVGNVATLSMSGGNLAGGVLEASGAGNIYIFADDFGPGYQAGQVITLSDLTVPFGSDMLGTSLAITFADNTQTSFDFVAAKEGSSEWTGALHLIPEPGTFALCAGFTLLMYRNRQSIV